VPDVVVLGDIVVDVLAPVDSYPPKGGHALAEGIHMAAGGSAANTALVLGRFGVDVAILGRVGDDPLADVALAALEQAGVDLSYVRRDRETMTALLFVVVTPDGERTMFGARGASKRLGPQDVAVEVVRQAHWLHLSGYTLLEAEGRAAVRRAVELAQAAGIPVSLDVGVGPAYRCRDEILALLPALQVILPNENEARDLTGETDVRRAAQMLQEAGAQEVVITRGPAGCHVATPAGRFDLPAFRVDAADATGAGDAFNAGWIAARLAGLDVRAAALLATALGSLKATVRGAGAALPTPRQLLAFLEAQRGRPEWQAWREELEAVEGFVRERVQVELGD